MLTKSRFIQPLQKRVLCCCIQHVFDKNAVAGGGIIDKDVGDSTNELAVLKDGTAGHECVK